MVGELRGRLSGDCCRWALSGDYKSLQEKFCERERMHFRGPAVPWLSLRRGTSADKKKQQPKSAQFCSQKALLRKRKKTGYPNP